VRRPRLRWEGNIRGWRRLAENRDIWRRTTEEARAWYGLSHHWRRGRRIWIWWWWWWSDSSLRCRQWQNSR